MRQRTRPNYRLLLQELEPLGTMIIAGAWTPDGQSLVVSAHNAEIVRYDLQGRLLNRYVGHKDRAWRLDISPDSGWLATAAEDSTARLWRIDGSLAHTFEHPTVVWDVEFNPREPTQLASADMSAMLRIWRSDGASVAKLSGHLGSLDELTYSPDGELLVSGDGTGRLHLWETAQWRRLMRLELGSGVLAIAFARDGAQFAVGTEAGTVQVLRRDGVSLAELQGGSFRANQLFFLSEGGAGAGEGAAQSLLVVSADRSVRVFPLQRERLLSMAAQRMARAFSEEERKRFDVPERAPLLRPVPSMENDCPSGLQMCEGRCFDTTRAMDACGGCGVQCAAGELCRLGRCVPACSDERLVSCDGRCVDARVEPSCCGASVAERGAGAGRVCVPPQVCNGRGECAEQCADGWARCGDRCVDLNTDEAHCGACGQACDGVCQAGRCGAQSLHWGLVWVGCNDVVDPYCHGNERDRVLVDVAPFWMDRLEVSNADYAACMQAGACPALNEQCWAAQGTTVGVLGEPGKPVVCVNLEAAQAYCAWRGKRLPTEAEFELASRGACHEYDDCRSELWRFPWGEALPRCELASLSLADCEGRGLMPVDTLAAGASRGGALHLVGNVSEMVSDCWVDSLQGLPEDGSARATRCSTRGGRRINPTRGGHYHSVLEADGRPGSRVRVVMGDAYDVSGFRCAQSAL
ncbi:MAG: SUMF1/EgtB/PvdO family nonheme iron enzyme [Myxococcota bacterium]|jgi:formylglycine-generating enzyme required for sulfatase activity|nr:SUMF1/EgtB/PvdO family nonheme iron enzyme [Myxococcota bacterium]